MMKTYSPEPRPVIVNPKYDDATDSVETEAEASSQTKMPKLGLASSHLRRTLTDIGHGLSTRLKTVQEAFVVKPAEELAWRLSGKLNHAKTKAFEEIDRRIEVLLAKQKKNAREELAIERFDDEGGAMMPTASSSAG